MQTRDIIAAIDREWVVERTLELVDIYSVTMDEAEVCRAYCDMMRGIGLEVDVREVTPGRNNLYARIAGQGDGPFPDAQWASRYDSRGGLPARSSRGQPRVRTGGDRYEGGNGCGVWARLKHFWRAVWNCGAICG